MAKAVLSGAATRSSIWHAWTCFV